MRFYVDALSLLIDKRIVRYSTTHPHSVSCAKTNCLISATDETAYIIACSNIFAVLTLPSLSRASLRVYKRLKRATSGGHDSSECLTVENVNSGNFKLNDTSFSA